MMTSSGLVSFQQSDSLLLCRNKSFRFTLPSAKFDYQMNLKMVLRGPRQAPGPCNSHIKCATARGNHCLRSSSDDELYQMPFWLTMIGDIIRSLRSLALFLIEQPGQLKYIEWPTVGSTAKTAALTLVLVALFMVSLATVDSFLLYIFALFSRKSAR